MIKKYHAHLVDLCATEWLRMAATGGRFPFEFYFSVFFEVIDTDVDPVKGNDTDTSSSFLFSSHLKLSCVCLVLTEGQKQAHVFRASHLSPSAGFA